MQHDISAYPACLCQALGLSAKDLAEIGGFSEQTARAYLRGAVPFKPDVIEALEDIQDDCDTITDLLTSRVRDDGAPAIYVYPTTAALREAMPEWPGRGHAAGGFPGPQRIAALTAFKALASDGIDVDLRFA